MTRPQEVTYPKGVFKHQRSHLSCHFLSLPFVYITSFFLNKVIKKGFVSASKSSRLRLCRDSETQQDNLCLKPPKVRMPLSHFGCSEWGRAFVPWCHWPQEAQPLCLNIFSFAIIWCKKKMAWQCSVPRLWGKSVCFIRAFNFF